jgi:regulatory protein
MDLHDRVADPSLRRRTRRPTRPLDAEMDIRWLTDHALRYIGRWESSAAAVGMVLERRIRERCARTDEDPALPLSQIPEVLDDLVARGYIDDRRYATSALDRMRGQGRSTAEIRARLAAKDVDESIVRELLRNEEPESDVRAAWRLAKRRRLGPYCRDTERRQRDRNRHLGILARHGFDRMTAEEVIDASDGQEFAL